MYRYMILLALVLFTTVDVADAGVLFRRRCNRVVVTRAVVVNKVVDVQFTPTFVSFVPSQVLLNGQVTTYGTPQTFGYSYQGSYQQQQQAQPAAAAQPNDRTAEILRLLKKIAGEDPASVSTASATGTHTIFSGSCKGCHSPGGKGAKDLLMYDASGVLKDRLPRYDIYKSIHEGSMPKGGPRIEDPKKLEAVRNWLHDGLPGVEF
jgi:mono/diheme cytochrome c family protein